MNTTYPQLTFCRVGNFSIFTSQNGGRVEAGPIAKGPMQKEEKKTEKGKIPDGVMRWSNSWSILRESLA